MAERRGDQFEARARELAIAAGLDPDARIERVGAKAWPAWCQFRTQAIAEHNARRAAETAPIVADQPEAYRDAPLVVVGDHEEDTIRQMRNCMSVGRVVAGVICADGHLGYAQPVGGVIAYDRQISISGVGFDIACGNMAVRLDMPWSAIEGRRNEIAREIASSVSFGIGRVNEERVDADLFDDGEAWRASGMEDYRQKARAQLGTVGSGNHYVDVMTDADEVVWIGVHFGSRGLGHTSATRYIKAAGGKDGIHVPPVVVDEDSEIGERYLAAMHLAGRYAYAGREWVVKRVRRITGGQVVDSVHNHHNFAWRENHGGRDLWVVRKGATPAFPGQRGFIGGSMGDDAVIVSGTDAGESSQMLHSTIHGAGRVHGRQECKRRFARSEMDAWINRRGVTVLGGDLDESPMAYRRLNDVLAHHANTIAVEHVLTPRIVVMAGAGEVDPFKD